MGCASSSPSDGASGKSPAFTDIQQAAPASPEPSQSKDVTETTQAAAAAALTSEKEQLEPQTKSQSDADLTAMSRILTNTGTNSLYPEDIWNRYSPDGDHRTSIIGKGNFGTVLRAVDKESGQKHAIKFIKKKRIKRDEHLRHIQKEIDVMSTLGGSLNCVLLHEIYEDNDYIYMVMELCSGGTLEGSFDVSTYSEAKVAQIMRSVLQVCAQCHAKGIVHRDLKPENFLFSHSKVGSPLKVTDFGLATYWDPGDQPLKNISGTPQFMAPEVIRQRYGSTCDVWSAGVMCYLLLTGRLPFRGLPRHRCKDGREQLMAVFSEVLHKKLDLQEDPWPSISEPAKDLVRKLLVRDPDVRWGAEKALGHPWVREGGYAPLTPLAGTIVQRLQRYGTYGRFRQSLLAQIARRMASSWIHQKGDLAQIRDAFHLLDSDGSGEISYQELVLGFQKCGYNLSEEEAAHLMAAADLDSDGHLDYEEFLAALTDWGGMDHTSLEWDQAAREVFTGIDMDGDGQLDAKEIAQLFGSDRRAVDVQAAMREVDLDGDGAISMEEFLYSLREPFTNTRDKLGNYTSRLVGPGGAGAGEGGGGAAGAGAGGRPGMLGRSAPIAA